MKSLKQNFYSRNGAIISAFLVIELLISAPAFAHHPLDGRLPANLFEGLMSGLGHAVIGFDAETTPLLFYLIGFTLIQLVISIGTYFLATKLSKKISLKYITRLSGLAISAIGMVFLSSAIVG